MKKYNYLPVLLVFIFLLLCACAKEQADPTPSGPDTLSSSINVTPASRTPDPRPPATSKPATSKPATSKPATSKPATKPRDPIQLTTDWMVTDREIIPFEERFETDIPFPAGRIQYYGMRDNSWLSKPVDGISVSYSAFNTGDKDYPLAILENGDTVYEIACDRDLYRHASICSDGRWAFFFNPDDTAIIRVDLFTGQSTNFLSQPSSSEWEVFACGKDTLLIFAVNKSTNQVKIYYKDLHSDAEKVVYEGLLPNTSAEDLHVYNPTSTQSPVQWRMMNPAFYEKLQKELSNPKSQFRTDGEYDFSYYWDDPTNNPVSLHRAARLCANIQNHYNIPAQVMYSVDPLTGVLTADYGIIDNYHWGVQNYHDHFGYEDTHETPVTVLTPEPQPVSNLTVLTPEQAATAKADEHNRYCLPVMLYYDSGFAYPYLLDSSREAYPYLNFPSRYTRLTDIPCKEIISTADYIYCITDNNTILQIAPNGVCNTIYTSDTTLSSLCHYAGSIYFVDGNTVMRIDTINGTCTAILRSTGKLTVDDYGYDPGQINILVVQGLYTQQYFFNPDTLELEKTRFYYDPNNIGGREW